MSAIYEMMKNAPRKHKLVTKAIEKNLPALDPENETPLGDKTVVIKFFSPYNGWTWYGLEYDKETKEFFGYVVGLEAEAGYFSLEELESHGAFIERDLHWSPIKLKDCYGVEL